MSVKERQTKSSLGCRNTVPKGNGSTTAETMFVILASYREWAPNPNACRHSYCVLVKQTGRSCAEVQTDDCMPALDLPEFVPRLLAAENSGRRARKSECREIRPLSAVTHTDCSRREGGRVSVTCQSDQRHQMRRQLRQGSASLKSHYIQGALILISIFEHRMTRTTLHRFAFC